MFKKFVSWIFQSSENPSQVSLTLKGIVVAVIPWIVTAAGIFHFQVSSVDVANVGNSLVTLVYAVLTAIGAGIAFYGFIRKLINTFFIPWPSEVSTLMQPTQTNIVATTNTQV